MSRLSNNIDVCQFPQIKGFVVDKKLGSGSYASVYKAHAKSNPNEIFAIKCIKKNSLNKSSTENLLREIKILKQIKHDFVVEMIDFQWDEHFIYIIMEFCPGGDLSTFIKSRQTIPEKYVRRFVQQIACALKHLHSKGIAHMDLKPQNILLTSTNNPSLKMADFGFAQYMREREKSESLRGSPLYMAPEILKCKVYDSKVDLWSVGVILHEVIFGYAPFVSNTFSELEQKIMDDTPIQIPTHIMLSDTCKDLLIGLLQRNPNDRISFEQFFNHPFVDLDHMPSSFSLPRASDLLKKAIRADEGGDYLVAQRFYLQAIEYLIPAIQYEKDYQKKQEIREKANIYLKRSEDIANFIKPRKVESSKYSSNSNVPSSASSNSSSSSDKSIPIYSQKSPNDDFLVKKMNKLSFRPTESTSYEPKHQQRTVTSIPIHYENINNMEANSITVSKERHSINENGTNNTNASLNFVTSLDLQANGNQTSSIWKLLKLVDGNKDMQDAIRSCIDADEKLASESKYEELFNQYQNAIAVMLPYVKNLPKDTEACKLFKINIERWLTKAEKLKEKLKQQQENLSKLRLLKARDSINKEDDDLNNPYTKHCIIS